MRLLFAVLLASLAACSSNPKQEEAEPADVGPKSLSAFEEEASLDHVWHKQIGKGLGKAFAGLRPTIHGDKVFVADAFGLLQALDLESGDVVWEQDLQTELTAAMSVAKDLAFVASSNGDVIALDLNDGSQRWSSTLNSEVLSAPVANGDVLAVQTIDGKLHLLDFEGKQLWSYDSNLPALTLRGTSAPVFYNDSVIAAFANGKVVGLSLKDGSILWNERVGVPAGRSELERLVDVDGSLLIRDDQLYVSGYQGHIAAIDLRSGKMMWKREASSYHGPIYGLGNLYMVSDEDFLTAFDDRSGSDVWAMAELQGRQLSEPVFFNNYIAVSDFEGYIHLVKQLDGALVGREQVARPALDWVRTGSYGKKHPSRYFSKDPGLRTKLQVKGKYLLAINNSGFLNLFELAQ